MITSMTGFGTSTLSIPLKESVLYVTISIKTLNSRFFESNCKIPYALTDLETVALKKCKAAFFRGTLFFTVHIHNPSLLKGTVIPSRNMIDHYLIAINDIKQHTAVEGTITLSDLINLPNIFEIPEESLPAHAHDMIMKEIDAVIATVATIRQQEGADLLKDLETRVLKMQQLIARIKPRAQEVLHEKKATLSVSLAALPYQEGSENKEQHLLTLYSQLDRIDVHEEIVRFTTHLTHFDTILHNNESEKGKKLDFILQEMFREINTMNAKCSDSVMSEYAIGIKSELEKAREQVQNVV